MTLLRRATALRLVALASPIPGLVALLDAGCSEAPPTHVDVGSGSAAVTETCSTTLNNDRSLFVALREGAPDGGTGKANAFGVAVLKNFSFEAVLEQIIATGTSGSSETVEQQALALYDQLTDTLNAPPGDTDGPHCTGTINGFPASCPRPEGALATTNPFTGTGTKKIGQLTPVALVNRFDLAPSDGANCGEYRVVFGMKNPPAPVIRFLMIFEATLPNPSPALGLPGCLPVAQFWDHLSAKGLTESEFVAGLTSFYFQGLTTDGGPSFAPVISAQNYGLGGPSNTNTGQIRANFLSVDWQLREFTLSQTCSGGVCTLTANNTFAKDNPFGNLFALLGDGGADAGAAFQNEFISQVQALSAPTIPAISMSTPNQYNSGQSDESNSSNDYGCLAGLGGTPACTIGGGEPPANTPLSNAIQAELNHLGSTLTPDNIVQRATTQSCAGCHELSPGVNLGGGLVWPESNGFTQIDEDGDQSPALTTVFVPFRAGVLTNFINGNCGTLQAATGNAGTSVSGRQRGATN